MRYLAILAAVLSPMAAFALGDIPPEEQQSPAGSPAVEWAVHLGQEDTAKDEADGIAISPGGLMSASGVFSGTLPIGLVTLTEAGRGDAWVASWLPDGTFLWAKRFGSTGADNVFDMTVDGDSNIILSGQFTGTMAVGGTSLTSAGSQDMFVIKLDLRGNVLWAKRFGGVSEDGGNEVYAQADGSLAVIAMSAGSINIGGVSYPGNGSRGTYVIRLDAAGGVVWSRPFNGTGNERGRAVTMDAAGNVWLGMQFKGQFRHATGTIEAVGDWDGALVALDPTGAQRWVRHVGSAGFDNLRGLDLGPDGSVYAGGAMSNAGTFLGAPAPSWLPGGNYVARLSTVGTLERIIGIKSGTSPDGNEVETTDGGVWASNARSGTASVTVDGTVVWSETGSGTTSYLIGVDHAGAILGVFSATPLGSGASARGGPLDGLQDGSRMVQVIRSDGQVSFGGLILDGNGSMEPTLVSVTP